jgi:hypothetical protein
MRKMWSSEADRIVRTENFAATATFTDVPAAGANRPEGRLRFGAVRRLVSDDKDVTSRIIPVKDTKLFVQVQSRERGQTEIFVLGPEVDKKRLLASFPVRYNDANDGAYAVTRSGRYVLLADAQRLAMWNVVEWREVDRNVGSLGVLLRTMIHDMRNPGEWWVTDDLKFIVASCAEGWTEDGYGVSKGSNPANLGDVTIDVVRDGVVFNRQRKRMSTFPVRLGQPAGLRVFDAESVNGDLTLLYVDGNSTLTTTVADGTGRPRATHVLRELLAKSCVGWDPGHGEVYLLIRDSDGDNATRKPDANNHLVVWDVAKDRERRFVITVEQLRDAIEGHGASRLQ